MDDETGNLDRSFTKNDGPASDACKAIRARDFTGSSLCHIINIYNSKAGRDSFWAKKTVRVSSRKT